MWSRSTTPGKDWRLLAPARLLAPTFGGVGDSIGINEAGLALFPELVSLGLVDKGDQSPYAELSKSTKVRIGLKGLPAARRNHPSVRKMLSLAVEEEHEDQHDGSAHSDGFVLDAVVFLTHSEADAVGIRELSFREAMRRYQDEMHVGERTQLPASILSGTSRLLAGPCFELRYSSREDQRAGIDLLLDSLR